MIKNKKMKIQQNNDFDVYQVGFSTEEEEEIYGKLMEGDISNAPDF